MPPPPPKKGRLTDGLAALKSWANYRLIRAADSGLGSLTPVAAARIGAAIATVVEPFAFSLNKTFETNWRIAFGRAPTRAERRNCWQTLFANLITAPSLTHLPESAVLDYIEIAGYDDLNEALQRGRGAILLGAHLSSWEVLAQTRPFLPPFRFHTLYQPLQNPKMDEWVRSQRSLREVGLISRHNAWKTICQCLRKGDAVAVFADQHAGDHGVWTPLFGKMASTTPLPALLAQRTGAAIVPCAAETRGPGKWTVRFFPSIPARGRSIEEITADCNAWIESAVRERPADWLWLHERWKLPNPRFLLTRPDLRVHVPHPKALQPLRIVVRGLNWLGDAAMNLAALRNLKQGRLDVHLTVLCRQSVADLYRACPFVDEVLTLRSGDGLWAAARLLRQGRFEAILLMPNSWRVVLEAWLGGISRRIGYRVRGRGRTAINHKILPKLRARNFEHQSLTWLRAIESLGGTADASPVTLLPANPLPRTLGLIAPGAAFGPAKRWGPDRFARAATSLSDKVDRWILVGAPGDALACDEVARHLPGVENLCGKTTIPQLMELLAQARLLLCNDSGTMHLAALCETPSVAIFGSTEPRATGPLSPKIAVLRHHVPCSPCLERECPLGSYACLDAVTVQEVVRAAESLLADNKAPVFHGMAHP
jgi:ADP-heptose:LPS heptosyltransferase/lauroyl/myristoyl acyltransferase